MLCLACYHNITDTPSLFLAENYKHIFFNLEYEHSKLVSLVITGMNAATSLPSELFTSKHIHTF